MLACKWFVANSTDYFRLFLAYKMRARTLMPPSIPSYTLVISWERIICSVKALSLACAIATHNIPILQKKKKTIICLFYFTPRLLPSGNYFLLMYELRLYLVSEVILLDNNEYKVNFTSPHRIGLCVINIYRQSYIEILYRCSRSESSSCKFNLFIIHEFF